METSFGDKTYLHLPRFKNMRVARSKHALQANARSLHAFRTHSARFAFALGARSTFSCFPHKITFHDNVYDDGNKKRFSRHGDTTGPGRRASEKRVRKHGNEGMNVTMTVLRTGVVDPLMFWFCSVCFALF